MSASILIFLVWLILAALAISVMRWVTGKVLLKLKGWALAFFALIHVSYLLLAIFLWTRMILIMLNPAFNDLFWTSDGVARELFGLEVHLLVYVAITSGAALAVDMIILRVALGSTLGKSTDARTGIQFGRLGRLAVLAALDLLLPAVVAIAMWML